MRPSVATRTKQSSSQNRHSTLDTRHNINRKEKDKVDSHHYPPKNAFEFDTFVAGMFSERFFRTTILVSKRIRRSSLTTLRLFSSSTNASNNPASLKKLIQPFVLKCHPDMAKQQGLPKTAQQVNLRAIQNLNSYVDGTISLTKGGPYPFSSYQTGLIQIEFVMAFSSTGSKAANPTTSRRRVELKVPSPTLEIGKVEPHVQRQVVKLLRMADLRVPDLGIEEEAEEESDGPNKISHSWMANQVVQRRKTAWDRSRERFLSRLNRKKFDAMYQQALGDAQAHVMTKNMIRYVRMVFYNRPIYCRLLKQALFQSSC